MPFSVLQYQKQRELVSKCDCDWYVRRYDTSAISVRLGKVVPQSLVKNFDRSRCPLSQWKHICIEGSMTSSLFTAFVLVISTKVKVNFITSLDYSYCCFVRIWAIKFHFVSVSKQFVLSSYCCCSYYSTEMHLQQFLVFYELTVI